MPNLPNISNSIFNSQLLQQAMIKYPKVASMIPFDFSDSDGKGRIDRKEQILEVVEELALGFLCYDRANDEDLSEEDLLTAIRNKEVSVLEIMETFHCAILNNLPEE